LDKDWVNEQIRKRGIILLNGTVDEEMAERICSRILAYNMEPEVPRIQLIVNSEGGLCTAGFSIVDMMEWSSLPVYTTGLGQVASMGLMIFMAGEKGKRLLTPRTSILSHRHRGGVRGSHGEILAAVREQELNHERIVNHYLRYSTVSTREELEQTLLREVDTWLTPEEAIRYGLADVIEPMRRAA
jgi:ATP-dependent Clp protease protease subunit